MAFSAYDSFKKIITDYKDKVAFISIDDDQYSVGCIIANALLIAKEWEDAGVVKGDKIALHLDNSIGLLCCYFACAINGYIACPIVPSLKKDKVDQLLNLVNPKKVMVEQPVVDKNCILDNLYFLDNIDFKARFLVMFSSGSTGVPKAICHSFKSILHSATVFAELTNMNSETRLYHNLPMTYMAGFLNAFFAPFMAGSTIVEGDLFAAANSSVDFWERPLGKNVNTLSIIPTIAFSLCRLTRNKEKIELIKKKIKQVQCTSAPLQLSLRKMFLDKFNIPLQDCYGMTEIGGPLTFQTYEDAKDLNSKLQLVNGLEAKIDENSHLLLNSPFAMLGYLEGNNLINISDKDGFIDTGDLATYENNKMAICGRAKDLIIRGGVNVSPIELESVIGSCEGIDDVAVIGVEHDFWGEEIVAFLIAHDKSDEYKAKMMTYLQEKISKVEFPDKFIFLDEFPRSFIGKILKKELKKEYVDRPN